MRSLALVLGAGGQLGEAMTTGLARACEVVALSRRELDVSVAESARAAITAICPDVIVNCAAYTAVDAAEEHAVEALAANAWAVRTLSRVATDISAALVHFSTDFVFDGVMEQPYDEDDPPNPRGTHAASKLLGEWFAAETPRHYVLRVESLFGGPRAQSSVDRMLEAMRSGREVRAFSDRTVSPSYVEDVVGATLALLDRRIPYGLYHCVNSGWTTWSALAHELVRLTGFTDATVHALPMADAKLPVPRPQFAALSNAKLTAAGVLMPTWQDALARYVGAK